MGISFSDLAATGAAGFLHVRIDPVSGSPVGFNVFQVNGLYLLVKLFLDREGDAALLEDFVVC